MFKERLVNIIKRLTELFVSLALAMLFFGIVLLILDQVFPTGLRLNPFSGDDKGLSGLLERDTARNLLLARHGGDVGLGERSTVVAVLSGMENKVKNRRAAGINWGDAREGMELFNLDAIQTFNYSSAEIKFDEENYLEVGSNSLIIIKSLERDPIFREKRTFLVMVDGEIRGRIASAGKETVQLEIATPGAVTRIKTNLQPEGQVVDFRLTVNPDSSSTIAVFGGFAEVISEAGERVRVESNQSTYIFPGKAPMASRELLTPARLQVPSDQSLYYYRSLPPKINFRWKAQRSVKKFRFIIARDEVFRDVVVDEILAEKSFVYGNLKKGAYYWRVTSIDEVQGSVESLVRKVEVVQDRKPPALMVNFPPRKVTDEKVLISGTTEPKSRIFVMGKEVSISGEGKFNSDLELPLGLNVIVVESVDVAGNVSYRSQVINRKM